MTHNTCVLGSDFFNATIHFNKNGNCFQTTPGMSMGRAGFKQPGYRSVKRCIKDPESNTVTIYSNNIHGECRITENDFDSTIKFEEIIPPECLVNCASEEVVEYNLCAWTADYLLSGDWDSNVIVWQWCRGVPEHQGNLMVLSDEWWCPYLATENSIIETAFLSNKYTFDVELPICGTRTFKFNPGQAFASQNDTVNNKTRMVRRVTKTIQELKTMLDRMSTPPVDISKLFSSLPAGTTPHHFFCCITQDLMSDPVKTIDNHIYDRPAIERWFIDHNTSPLTGLHLTSLVLKPQNELRQHIESFVQSQVAP